MIVKILSKSASFKGVNYNTDKVEKDKGELMKVENFGALQALDNLRPQDYVNYLEAISSKNKRVKCPQFHAVISCKGREKSKEELTELAENWLKGMGYGGNPYLLIFHKDTLNNHIHMVSSRVNMDGKKIADSYEKLRAYEVLNEILGIKESRSSDLDVKRALAYQFSTRAQFMMLLEASGYSLAVSDSTYKIIKYGKEQSRVELSEVDKRIASYQKNPGRLKQIRAIVEKYRSEYDPGIYPKLTKRTNQHEKVTAYSSLLADMLKEKFGIQVLFHARENKLPYGYTIIDHAAKAVYKGGDLMPLQGFIASGCDEQIGVTVSIEPEKQENNIPKESSESYQDQAEPLPWTADFNLDIADDIDDETVHRRNRKGKGKPKTHSR